VNKVP